MEEKKNAENDYKILMDMVNEAKENYEMYKGLVEDSLKQNNISLERAKFLFNAYSKDDIEALDCELAKEMLIRIRSGHSMTEIENADDMNGWVKSICANNYDGEEDKYDEYYEENECELIKKALQGIKQNLVELKQSEDQVADIENEAGEVRDQYMNYLCSPEYEEKKYENYLKLKDKFEEAKKSGELSEYEISQLKEKLTVAEYITNLEFLLNRFKANDKSETKSIVKSFFDDKKSAYIIQRYKEKIQKIGYNKDIYKYYFNIEENYLSEEYHVFNNLFLFITMRFVSYCNIDKSSDCSYVRALNSAIAKLIYEKYPNDELKNKFIDLIKSILDYFNDYRDEFEEKNYLHPKHPERIKKEKKHEDELREMIISNMISCGYDVTDEVKALPINVLKETYKNVLNDIEKSNKENAMKDLTEFIEKTSPKGDVEEVSDNFEEPDGSPEED